MSMMWLYNRDFEKELTAMSKEQKQDIITMSWLSYLDESFNEMESLGRIKAS